ncbi:hypothetical protein [Candidatus Palauibacter sp.]|uniref:hypothetical protein n=1 Tax=Candidatus Palauibacter sp. TaxID=3101350 RepID=UPI003AF2F9B9
MTNAPLDQWLGVQTDEQGRVTHLHLQENNLRGPIAPELGNLSHLTSLSIWGNPLSGPIPAELGTLSNLRQLELSLDTENTLEGPIPPEIGSLPLRTFYLVSDGVTGPIPPEFGQLSSLSAIALEGEKLSGPVPEVFLRLTGLNFAKLTFCIPGTPDWILWAERIETLYASFCNEADIAILNALFHGTGGPDWTNNEGWLQGSIAEWYGVTADSIGFVVTLDLSHNGLTGQLPSGLGHLEHLTELSVEGNRLTGPLPLSLAGTRLRTFHYRDTDLCVPSDSTFRAWLTSIESHVGTDVQCEPSERQTLEALYGSTGGPNWGRSEHWLSARPLGEWYGVSVDSAGRVTAIELRNNGLIGSLPVTLGNLTELRDLALPFNRLSGPVPAQLSELTKLTTLFLGHNDLYGSIPPELGELQQLRYLDLDGNRLTGELPGSLGGLESLDGLWLEQNEFTGPIPPELSDLTQLRQLKLRGNQLTGEIPPQLGNLVRLDQLMLGSNDLTGEIPPELGNLVQLYDLNLARNDLTGSIPRELGELRQLRQFNVSATRLAGEIPESFLHLPSLDHFSWGDTDLCSPLSREFQDWLAGIEGVRGEPCVRGPLTAFYRSAGGERWTRKANWLTPGPIADWYGVTVDDRGLPVALELGGNGLDGSIAPELGEFVELRALDLSGNALTGQLPGELGRLDRLRTLDISDNQFTGALPSSFVELAELASFRWDNSGACAPSASWFQNWLRSIEDQVAGAGCGEVPVLLGMPSVYLNQAVQNLEGQLPLVAGRAALLRVHATSDQANEYQPRARASFFQDGVELADVWMDLASSRGIPSAPEPGDLARSFSAVIPGEWLAPGLEMVVEVDPDSVVPRAAGSVTRVPAEGRLKLDVVEAPPLDLTIVPILSVQGRDSTVLDWTQGATPGQPVAEFVRNILPLHELRVSVRAPYVSALQPRSAAGWGILLRDVELIRTMDNGTGHYYGAMVPYRQTSDRGAAQLPGTSSVGVPDATVLVHQLGHNLSLRHAPCGLLSEVDPDYPYPGGGIGVWGYDARGDSLISPSTPDVMGLGCEPAWISDYHYKKALEYRAQTAEASSEASVAGRERLLLLWGGIGAEGELHLDPAFALHAPEKLPTRSGPFRLDGFDAGGETLFSLPFSPAEVDHGGSNFLFTIPFEADWRGRLDRIVLSGPGGMTALDGDSNIPMAIIMDRPAGRIRGILRGAEAVRATSIAGGSGFTTDPDLDGLPLTVPN